MGHLSRRPSLFTLSWRARVASGVAGRRVRKAKRAHRRPLCRWARRPADAFAHPTIRTRLIARVLWPAPGTPQSEVQFFAPRGGAERRQTRGFARPPERLAKPPETLARRLLIPCDRDEAPPGAPLAAVSVPLGPRFRSATGHDGPYPERWPPLLHRPHVQPCSWAAGRNAGGRLAGGLPSPAYEAGSRAPHRRDGFPRFVRRDNKAASPARPSPLLRPRHVSGDAPRRAGRKDYRLVS